MKYGRWARYYIGAIFLSLLIILCVYMVAHERTHVRIYNEHGISAYAVYFPIGDDFAAQRHFWAYTTPDTPDYWSLLKNNPEEAKAIDHEQEEFEKWDAPTLPVALAIDGLLVSALFPLACKPGECKKQPGHEQLAPLNSYDLCAEFVTQRMYVH